MPFSIHAIPAFDDNYIWLIRAGQNVAVIDPGDDAPVEAYLAAQGLQLQAILLTHHHHDHIGGVEALRARHACPVYGAPMQELATITHEEGQIIDLSAHGLGTWQVLCTPGHTLDHRAYYHPGTLFCGDTLFGAGCGRLFEGSAEQMQASLEKIRALPDDTLIYCGHEYTEDNLRFAALAEPHNRAITQRILDTRALRASGQPSIPSRLALEKASNPFLRWDAPGLLHHASAWAKQPLNTPADIFAAVRAWKDEVDRQG